MKCHEFLGGFIIGAAIGTLAGLLFAPQSGEETRDAVCKSAQDISGKLKESGQQLIESGRDLLAQGKSQVTEQLRSHGVNINIPPAVDDATKA